jgi:hypothetical protein
MLQATPSSFSPAFGYPANLFTSDLTFTGSTF